MSDDDDNDADELMAARKALILTVSGTVASVVT